MLTIAAFGSNMFQTETKTETKKENKEQQHVWFNDVPKAYQKNDDIFVMYTLNGGYEPSSRDWVGFYRTGYKDHTREYITYEWAPKYPQDAKRSHIRSILFSKSNLGVEYDSTTTKYQFIYVARNSNIMGISKAFSILDEVPIDNINIEMLECPLSNTSISQSYAMVTMGKTSHQDKTSNGENNEEIITPLKVQSTIVASDKDKLVPIFSLSSVNFQQFVFF